MCNSLKYISERKPSIPGIFSVLTFFRLPKFNPVMRTSHLVTSAAHRRENSAK